MDERHGLPVEIIQEGRTTTNLHHRRDIDVACSACEITRLRAENEWINKIGKLFWDNDKSCYAPGAIFRMVQVRLAEKERLDLELAAEKSVREDASAIGHQRIINLERELAEAKEDLEISKIGQEELMALFEENGCEGIAQRVVDLRARLGEMEKAQRKIDMLIVYYLEWKKGGIGLNHLLAEISALARTPILDQTVDQVVEVQGAIKEKK